MSTLRVLPDDVDVEAADGTTILAASQDMGLSHTAVCGGRARCSTCRVVVESGLEGCSPRGEAEQAIAERLHFAPEIRLACQTTFADDLTVRRLVLDEDDLQLAKTLMTTDGAAIGEERKIGILFADLRGSTPFAESLPPYDVIHAMNRYFLNMGRVVADWGGYIESYRGDGLLALFGVDDKRPDPALCSVKAALAMLEQVDRLNPGLERSYGKRFEVVIGVHYGLAVVGTIGFGEMAQSGAFGDSVNLAARIEDVNKKVGSKLLISNDLYREVKDDVVIGRKFRRTLKGKTGRYALFEVLGLRE